MINQAVFAMPQESETPHTEDSYAQWKEMAKDAAEEEDVARAISFAQRYIQESLDLEFARSEAFSDFYDDPQFQQFQNSYLVKGRWGSLVYIYAGLIGLFIVVMFNLQPKQDRVATVLLSILIFIHAFFIIHVGLHSMNYDLYYPHLYSSSTIFSLLYGPLLYFYFKRIKTGYRFKWRDLLHLAPTLVLIGLFIPVFILPADEKLKIMLGVGIYQDRAYGLEISSGKMLSLIIYSFLTARLFFRNKNKITTPEYLPIWKWQRNLVSFQVLFTLVYAIYLILLVTNQLTGPFFHLQLITLSGMVLYVAYMAYTNPKTLLGYQLEASFLKYKNSGLTNSFSNELKDEMIRLLEEEKIFQHNDINLNTISERLGTTRHNASQIINEHFNLSFFELINHYRIKEAKQIFEEDVAGQKNIIEVAYEVGYNNKVTFNKSFKKLNQLTPSQYLKKLRQETP
ncbi:hypothetical protein BST85_05130 [Aureitalea marina]|uniref:HTH araC/xylS-type domain-containing protein n=2 Tax=Aureitalea marina TaxID=930804 RepID=A0A2S7KP34_9FLAO|nr:hypothetical protein BST85_05130 [Aureitalea marina]